MSDYTPTTEDMRCAVTHGTRDPLGAGAEFDRWLAAHDAQVLADESPRIADYVADRVAEVRKQVAEEIAVEVENNVDWSNGRYDYGDNEGYEHAARIAREIGGTS